MRTRSKWASRFLFMVIFLAPTHLFGAPAARVEFIWGSAVAVTASGEKRELAKGASIEVGDTVISDDARLQLRFTDGGFVSLAPHSEFRINAYSYSGTPDGSERVAMELLKGGLRTISGLIGKAIQSAYEMRTAVATMGIRGTEYTVVYGDSVSGTVSAGAIAVCNAGGCLDVLHGQSYQVTDLNTKPVLISKAAYLPPPPPGKMEKKQATQTDIADLRRPSKVQSSGRGTNPTDMSAGGRRNDDRKVPDEGAQVSHNGAHEKSLSANFDSSMFKNTSVALKAEEAVQVETGSSSRPIGDMDTGGDGASNKERSMNPLQFDDNAGAVTGKGKSK